VVENGNVAQPQRLLSQTVRVMLIFVGVNGLALGTFDVLAVLRKGVQ